MTSESTSNTVSMKGVGPVGTLAAIVGLVGLIAMGTQNNFGESFMAAYVFGWSMGLCIVVGFLGLTLLHHTVRGYWGGPLLRMFEAGGGVTALGVMGALFIPIWMQREVVYHHWLHPDWTTNKDTWFKVAWLQENFFLGRIIAYFAIWMIYAYLMKTWGQKEDQTGDVKWRNKRTNYASPGLVVFVIVSTLASTDLFMSIDPHWFSTIFGPWFIINGALFAMALTTFVVARNATKLPYVNAFSGQLGRDLGNLLLAFTMLWIYFTLSQYIIIWSGNLPEFTTYYQNRGVGYLPYVGAFNVVFGWLVPWFLLFFPGNKTNPKKLANIALWIVIMRFVDLGWNMVPLFRPMFKIDDLFSLLFIIGAWLAVFGYELKKRDLVPAHDNRAQEALQTSHA